MKSPSKADAFAALHVKGAPLVLYNIWDAGGAKALVNDGAPAVATGSWSVAAAQGYKDGEEMPLDVSLQVTARIAATVDVPVSMDFEGGYAVDATALAQNTAGVVQTGAVGVNFEDRIVQGAGLHNVEDQAVRIRAMRQTADSAGSGLFINARTDLFLGSDPATHTGHVAEAITRAQAFAEAGASGFFIPGLTHLGLIAQITSAVTLPVNVMLMGAWASLTDIAGAGVARVSYGPEPYQLAMGDLGKRFASVS